MTGVRQPSVAQASSAGLDTEALQQLVGYNARRAALHLIEAFMQSMAAYGLRPVEFSVLSVVVHNPGVTSSQLSQALDLLAPNLVRLVQRLERRGLLSRQRDANDRRAIGLFATPEGAALMRRAQAQARASEAGRLAHLSAAEQATLRRLLKKCTAKPGGRRGWREQRIIPGMTQETPEGRAVERLVAGRPTSDGAGVKLTRVLTHDLQHRLDPFLMLDFFGSHEVEDYVGGFPDHPHRGFETITYMLHGRMRHRDSAGNEGLLQDGGVQWMTAGRGVIHSEMPEQSEGLMNGFQLWLNLPAKDKMTTPWYRDMQSAEIPEFVRNDGLKVRVIAGRHESVAALVQREGTEPLYLDIHNPSAQRLTMVQPVPAAHNAFAYVYAGELEVRAQGKTQTVANNRMAIFANQHDHVVLEMPPQSRAILVAGKPLGEPIVQYGPFVMNTKDEVMQAVHDYQRGVLA